MNGIAFALGRLFLTLGLIALVCAWIAQLSGGPIFGFSQQHLFLDAITLSLLGIGGLLDGIVHLKQRQP